MNIGIVGLGAMGRSLARALHAAGGAPGSPRLVAVSSRRPDAAQAITRELRGVTAVSYQAMAAHADLVLLAVSDADIGYVAADPAWCAGITVVHLSGARDLTVLEAASAHGARTGSFHPMVSVPAATVQTPHEAATAFAGAVVAIDGEPAVIDSLRALAGTLSLNPLPVPAAFRAHWHAAATMVGNTSAALAAHAEHLLRDLPADDALKRAALAGLLASVARNLMALPHGADAARAVSGPIARGDAATVQRHLRALQQSRDKVAYAHAASLVLLAVRDQLPPETQRALAALLSIPDLS